MAVAGRRLRAGNPPRAGGRAVSCGAAGQGLLLASLHHPFHSTLHQQNAPSHSLSPIAPPDGSSQKSYF